MKPLAILTPSITKPSFCEQHVESILKSTDLADVFVQTTWKDMGPGGYGEYIFEDRLHAGPPLGFGRAINSLWKAHPGYQYYMWGSDDVFFEKNGWLDKLLERMQMYNDVAIVWPEDSLTGHAPSSSLARFALTSGKVLDALGYFGLPGLFHWHHDDVMTKLSHGLGIQGFVSESVVFHKHNPAPMPEWWNSQQDTARYNEWMKNEFERDLAKVASLTRT